MKTYEQFINDKITYYHDNYDYESIFAYDGSNILAYITTGAITDENKLEGFNQPGTIWRDINAPRGTGSILYKLFIKNLVKLYQLIIFLIMLKKCIKNYMKTLQLLKHHLM